MAYPVSVVVPMYNAEKYIIQCAESLFNQTLQNIEFIFVNDCSQDSTLEKLGEVIEKYNNLKDNIKFYCNDMNRGSGYTRAKGLKLATGIYTIQIDSDDWVELDMCEKLYHKAIDFNADIVSSNFFMNYPDHQILIEQNSAEDPIKNFEGILLGTMHGSFCNKLVKRSLYYDNNIFPPTNFSLFEDKITTLQLYYNAKVVKHVDEAFLHYRQFQGSMTSGISRKHVDDTIKFITALDDFFITRNIKFDYLDYLNAAILYHKKIFLMDSDYFHFWDEFYPEVNKVRYVFQIQGFGLIKKIIYVMSIIISKNIMIQSSKWLKYFKSRGKFI